MILPQQKGVVPLDAVPQYCFGPVRPYAQTMGGFVPALQPFYDDPAPYAVEPFRIFGNLYYVGDQKVCMHLVDTGDGLILFDCGYGHTTIMIESSIRQLGFDPADVRLNIISHGHFDHFGSANALREKYGWRVLLSEADTQLLREDPRRSLIHLGPRPDDPVCWPDETIRDGQIIRLGSTSVRCVLSPGHTYGTMAFFFDVTDGAQTLRAGYFGGVGFLTVYGDYCREYGLPAEKCSRMKQSIERLLPEHVDITLGNHPSQNCTLEKRQRMLSHPGENPFVHKQGWQLFLHALEERRQTFESLHYGE